MTFDIATCMYYTGMDPFTKEQVYIARNLRDRRLRRARPSAPDVGLFLPVVPA